MIDFNIPQNDWKEFFKEELTKEYFLNLLTFLEKIYKTKTIYPKKQDIFNAYHYTPIKKIKVIILGQDPYHNPNEAQGLAFSVPNETKTPPSLRNIFKEIASNFNHPLSVQNDLKYLSDQGVFLLNTTLTVEKNRPNSHKESGWAIFTKNSLDYLMNTKKNLVFMLWGNFAHKIKIDSFQHLVLKSSHPSPLSAYRGFLGCNHFALANQYLKEHQEKEISWI